MSTAPQERTLRIPSLNRALNLVQQAEPQIHPVANPTLWLCLYFPALSFDALDKPADIVLHESGKRVHAVNQKAQRCGIKPGLPAAEAYAFSSELIIAQRDLKAERAHLERLAEQVSRFTPEISLEPPQALLLEIGRSLRLFGGLDALHKRIVRRLRQYNFIFTITPTALASLWLASLGVETSLLQKSELRSALARLPVSVLDVRLAKSCAKLGVNWLQELWRLPRAGLARRFGMPLLDRLDRALGITPDPRAYFETPPNLATRYEFPDATADIESLMFIINQQLTHLREQLLARDSALETLVVVLSHERQTASQFSIGLRQASRDPKQIAALIRLKLERQVFAAPVIAVSLGVEHLQAYTPPETNLFIRPIESPDGANAEHASDWQETLEQLQARLGSKAFVGLNTQPDYRPECAWQYRRMDRHDPAGIPVPKSNDRPSDIPSARPMWLLPEPQQLSIRNSLPWQKGPLTIEGKAERIASGWWEGRDIQRDYYIARNSLDSRLWVYRDRQGGWYLHGYFA